MVYRPKYLKQKKKLKGRTNEGIYYKSYSSGSTTLLVNGEEMTESTKKVVITIEAGCVPIVEITKMTLGDVNIDEPVQVIDKVSQGLMSFLTPPSQQGEILINIGDKEIGRVMSQEINKYYEQVDPTRLKL